MRAARGAGAGAFALVLVAVVTASPAARADEPETYSLDVLAADAASIALVAGSASASRAAVSPVMMAVGALGFAFGAPVVHLTLALVGVGGAF